MRQHTVNTPYMVGEAHFYTTEIDGKLVLFDTGPPTPEGLLCLQRAIDLARLKYNFITHCHVDHYGLAAEISRKSGAQIFISRKDAIKIRRHDERIAWIEALLVERGFDQSFILRLRETFGKNKVFAEVPERYRIVEESGIPEELGITWLSCPGHSQSDLVYLCGNKAVSGDVLLRNVFQAPLLDVDLETFSGRFRNYDAYCTSLLELVKLRGYQILPGHRGHVESLDGTILFYVRKLLERARQVKRFSAIESVRAVIERLFGDSLGDPFIVFLKVSEIVFMRDLLAEPEMLKRSLLEIGLFEQVSDLFAAVAE